MDEAMWEHQVEDVGRSWRMPAAALPWEPRLGKTRAAVETARRLREAGEIDAVLVIAPGGVHLNWTRVEVPKYDPGHLVLEWDSSKADTVRARRAREEAIKHDGFVWLSVNVEAVATPRLVNLGGKNKKLGYLERFVRDRRCLLIVDESHKIKNPRAKRTKAVMKIARQCPYRRNLTGTPVSQGPFDLWSQYHVLDPEILGRRFTTFKHRYGEFRRVKYGSGPSFDELVEYKNLDELEQRIAPYTFPRIKSECLDLPERVQAPRYFVLPRAHRRVYEELKSDLVAQLREGVEVSAPQAVTNLLRLQQVSRGHVTLEDGEVETLGPPYPAADATLELVRDNPGKTIVWCRFVADVTMVSEHLREQGIGHVVCDGGTPARDRPELVRRFREDDEVRAWVGTLATGGEGIDLGSANLMIFYSHGFDLVQRIQGLERNYGSSQKADRIDVVDLVAADTPDGKALAALERKEDLAKRLNGAKLRELLEE